MIRPKNSLLRINKIEGREPAITVLICLAISLIVYSPYVFGNYFYTFIDISSDTFLQFVPSYMLMSKTLQQGSFPFWSFSNGLGDNIYATTPDQVFDPFNLILFAFGDNLIYALPYIQIAKVLLTGLIACLFLKKLKHHPLTVVSISVLYAFNSDIIVRGLWYHHAIDTLLIVFMLYAFECYLQNNNCILLPIAGLFCILMRSQIYPYIYTLMLAGYSIFRYLYVSDIKLIPLIQKVFKLVGLYLLGIGLGGFFFIPVIMNAFSSNRSDAIGGSILNKVFSLTDIHTITTALLSLFSGSIMGTGSNFSGAVNILEAPLIYCGLAVVFFIPMAYFGKSKKHRVLFSVLLGICLSYIVWPFMLKIFNGPSELLYYKTSSFCIQIILLFIAAYGLDALLNGISLKRLSVPYAILFGLFFVTCLLDIVLGFNRISVSVFIWVLFLAGIYYMVFYRINANYRTVLSAVLLVCICADVTASSFSMVSMNKIAIPKSAREEGQFYWNDTPEIMELLNESDPTFFRINKTYNTSSVDAQFHHYYGTNTYESFINKNSQSFYQQIEPSVAIAKLHLAVPPQNYLLNSFLSVKYLLDNKNMISNDDLLKSYYTQVDTVGEVNIYRNNHTMPLGALYDQYIPYDDFQSLSYFERQSLLFYALAFEEGGAPPDQLTPYAISDLQDFLIPLSYLGGISVDADIEKFEKDLLSIPVFRTAILDDETNQVLYYRSLTDDPSLIYILKEPPLPPVSAYHLSFEGISAYEDQGQLYWRAEDEKFNELNSIAFDIKPGKNQYMLQFDTTFPVHEIRLDFGSEIDRFYGVSDVRLSSESQQHYEQIAEQIDDKNRRALNITSFKDSHITGIINTDTPQMLFLSIPYSTGWNAKINGAKAAVDRVNFGMCGLSVEPGESYVELWYIPPGLYAGVAISVISFFIYAVIIYVSLRKRRDTRKSKGESV